MFVELSSRWIRRASVIDRMLQKASAMEAVTFIAL